MHSHRHRYQRSPLPNRSDELVDQTDITELNTPIHHLDKSYARCMYLLFQRLTPLTISTVYHKYEHFINEECSLSIGLIISHTQSMVCNASREAGDHVAIIEACKQALLDRSLSTTDVCTCPKETPLPFMSTAKKASKMRRHGSSSNRFHVANRWRSDDDDDDEPSSDSTPHSSDEENEDNDEDENASASSSVELSGEEGDRQRRELAFKRKFTPGDRHVHFEVEKLSEKRMSPLQIGKVIQEDRENEEEDEKYKEEGEELSEEEIVAKVKEMQQRMLDDRIWLAKAKGVKSEHVSGAMTPEVEQEMERIDRVLAKKFYGDPDGPIHVSLKETKKTKESDESSIETAVKSAPAATGSILADKDQ